MVPKMATVACRPRQTEKSAHLQANKLSVAGAAEENLKGHEKAPEACAKLA